MGKMFNILYWNLNYKDGASAKTNSLMDASLIVLSKIDRIICEKENNKEIIDAIIFTEGYPQINVESKKCNIIKNYFDNKGYHIHPYTAKDKRKYKNPFWNGKKYVNGILIATKDNSFELIDKNIEEPNYLLLKNDKDLYLAGLRLTPNNGSIELPEIKRKTNCYDKIIVMGDFNMQPNKIDGVSNNDDWKFGKGLHKCNEATNFDTSFIDHIFIRNCKKKEFKRLEYMKNFYQSIGRLELIKKKKSKFGDINSPYPDHNLLFASIELN